MGHARPVVAGWDGLERMLRAQRRGCAIGGSDLYSDLLDAVMDDVRQGGPCHRALVPYAGEPMAHAVVLRFLAAAHELALDGSAPALAAHYPSCGGTPGPALGPEFVATVARHLDRVRARTADPLQTNEVGRSAALLGGFLAVARSGLPLRVLEVGASAGLNLHFDRFRYEAGDQAFGPADAPVRFVDAWTGAVPALTTPLTVAERRGCDARPLDPADPDDRLRLRASLWPDQVERRRRLEAALVVAATAPEPVPVDRADAAAWVAEQLAAPAPGRATVVVHTIVAQYLTAAARQAMERAIAEAGARATGDAPVAWLRMEPADDRHGEVRLTRWPSPGGPAPTEVLARSAFHGPPVHWLGR